MLCLDEDVLAGVDVLFERILLSKLFDDERGEKGEFGSDSLRGRNMKTYLIATFYIQTFTVKFKLSDKKVVFLLLMRICS